MTHFDMKVGFTCNNNCIHCVVGDKRRVFPDDLTLDEIKNYILTKANGADFVTLTGGEISIRPDFFDIVKFVYDLGMKVQIQTNGTGFADKELTQKLAPYINFVLIAIHSIDEEVHNKIVKDKTNKMFKTTMQGLQNIADAGIPFATQTVISSLNFPTLYETYASLQEKYPGIKMHLTYPHPMGNALENKDIVCLPYSSMKTDLQRIFRDFGQHLLVEAIPLCYIYPYEDKIYYNHDLMILKEVGKSTRVGVDPSNSRVGASTYDLFDEVGFTEDYSRNDLLSKRKGPKCKECVFNYDCPGVWKEYMDFFKNKLDLFPITKKIQFGIGTLSLKAEPCQNTCAFCSGGYNEEFHKSWEEIKQEADFFIDRGDTQIEISGEPSQHPLLVQLVTYLKNHGMTRIQVSTHGRPLHNKEFVRQLKEAGMTHIRIPLYGHTKEIHSIIVTNKPGTPGDPFDQAVEAIKNCVGYEIKICGHTLLHSGNKNDLDQLVTFYTELARDQLYEMVIQCPGLSQISHEYAGNWYVPIKDTKPYLKKLLDNPDFDDINLKIIGYPYCALGRYDDRFEGIHVAPDIGGVTSVGRHASPVNKKIPHYTFREKFEICQDCCLSDECSGTLKNDLTLFGFQGMQPIKE